MLALDKKIDKSAVALALSLVVTYLFIHGVAFIRGAVGGLNMVDLIDDAKPSLYWLAAPFFAIALSSEKMINLTAKIIFACGVILSLIYFLILIESVVSKSNFAEIYKYLNGSGEVFFRGENLFFYKGFLYLAISSIFLMASERRGSNYLLGLVLSALILTLTRGFVVSTALAMLLMLLDLRRWRALLLGLVISVGAWFLVWIYLPNAINSFSGQREVSNSIRVDDMRFIYQNMTPTTLLVGEGFGSYINNRLNIENTFLWILWKLGVVGIIFWLTPLALAVVYYRRTVERAPNYLASAFFYSVILVYIQTASNPFLNNPIGLSFVLIALFSLRTLSNISISDKSIQENFELFPEIKVLPL